MKIIDLTDSQNSLTEITSGAGIAENVILDFYANLCGPCKNLSKTYNSLAADGVFNNITVVKVNVDDHQSLASSYNVRSLPTMVFKNKDKIVKTKVGSLSKSDLSQMIKETYNYE